MQSWKSSWRWIIINRIYSFLGLATKAGKVISGEETCERAVKARKVRLVIVANDASESTKKKFGDICRYRGIEVRYFGEKKLLGKYIGKDIRSVVAVTGKEFAERLKQLIDSGSIDNGGGTIGEIQSI